MKHIAILSHKHGALDQPRYFLNDMAEIWREQGFRVSVLNGIERKIDADLAILNVDLTVIPDDYVNFIKQYPIVINGSIGNISKSKISANIVRRSDGYHGPVIVKSDLNCGGASEKRLLVKTSLLRRLPDALRKRLHWSLRSYLKTSDYVVFESVNDVPFLVWRNPRLVVEKFIPEIRDGYYCLRTWMFLGDKETISLSYSKEPIIKSSNVHHRETLNEVPDQLRQIRQEMGFDFGKFDYAIVDGQVILYDANRTPTLGSFDKEKFLPIIRTLAEGIHSFV